MSFIAPEVGRFVLLDQAGMASGGLCPETMRANVENAKVVDIIKEQRKRTPPKPDMHFDTGDSSARRHHVRGNKHRE